MRKFFAISVALISASACSSKIIKVVPDDCGPLARGELGVVFSLAPHGSGKGYFTEGQAMEVCPKIVNATYLEGYELEYCEHYEPTDPKECGSTKVFVITKYGNE